MYLIKVVGSTYSKEGNFSSFKLELAPILSNREANTTIYAEMWHRLRRYRHLLGKKCDLAHDFAASIYFTRSEGSRPGTIPAILAINNAENTILVLDHANTESQARKALKHMDRLLTELIMDDNHSDSLYTIQKRFQDNSPEAGEILKNFLKFYSRGKGLLIDENDLAHAVKQAKERRRSDWEKSHQS